MSVARHTTYNFLGRVFPLAIALVSVPVLLRLIGAEKFGVLAVLWALLNYFAFFDFGLGKAVSQRIAKLSDQTDTERSGLVWSALLAAAVLAVVGGLLIWGVAYVYISRSLDLPEDLRSQALESTQWLALAVPLLLQNSILQGALQGRFCFAEVNIAQVIGGALSQLLPLMFVLLGYHELSQLILATLASRFFVYVYLVVSAVRNVPLKMEPFIDWSHLQPMARYGGWISVMSILGPLLVTIDRFIIASILGAKAVAYYTVPFDLVSRTMMISGSLSSAVFPKLASEGSASAKSTAVTSTRYLMAIMSPLVAFGIFLVDPFLSMWIGQEFASSARGVGEIILVGVWLNAVVVPQTARLLAAGNPRNVVLIYLLEIPIYLVLLYFGILAYGILGAAAAWSLRVLLDTSLLLILAGEFARSLRSIFPSVVLIGCVTILAIKLRPDTVESLFFATCAMLIAVIVEREYLSKILRHVAHRTSIGNGANDS